MQQKILKHTPKTTCLLSSQSHFAHVIKNCKQGRIYQ